MGWWPDSVFCKTNKDSTDTHSMVRFTDAVLQLETPVLPMVCYFLPPHTFHPNAPLACT